MNLKINGDFKSVETSQLDPNMEEIIEKLELNPKLIVVEYNGAILDKQNWKSQIVQEGDILEIVTIVGGGS